MHKSMIGCYNLIEKNNKLLLVKESRRLNGLCWALPAGKLEVGETLPEAAIREAYEETGLQVTPTELVGIYQTPELLGSNVLNIAFHSEIKSSNVSSLLPEATFFTPQQIQELLQQKLLRDFIVKHIIQDFYKGKRAPLTILQTLNIPS